MLYFIFFIASTLLSIILSSNNLIQAPIEKKLDASIYLEPNKLIPQNNDFKFITFLYNIFIYIVFDITYIRICLPGKYFKYYSFQFFKIWLYKFIFHIYYFIIKKIYYICNIIYNKKPYNIWHFININYNNEEDNRKLFYNNHEGWKHNPILNPAVIYNILQGGSSNINISEAIVLNLLTRANNTMWNLSALNKVYDLSLIKNANRTIKHYAIKNDGTWGINNEFFYFTELNKSIDNLAFGNTVVAPKVILFKPSSLITSNNNITQVQNTNFQFHSSRIAQDMINFRLDPEIINYMKQTSYNPEILPSNIKQSITIKEEFLYNTKLTLLEQNFSNTEAENLSLKILNVISDISNNML